MYDFLLVFGLILWAGLAWWYYFQPVASAYHPATYYLLFHGLLFAIRPILARLQTFDAIYQAMQFDPTLGERITVLLGADLALAVFLLVCIRVGNAPFTRAPAARRGPPASLDWPYWLMLAICLPLAVASLVSNWSGAAEQISTMTHDSISGRAINTSANGYFVDAMLMLGPIAALTAWAGRFRPLTLVPMIIFVFVKAGTGGRWPFVMGVMSCALFFMYDRRLRWPPKRMLVFAVPLILLFTIIGEDRGGGIREWISGKPPAGGEANYFAMRPLESMDYGNMEFFEYLVHVVPKRSGTYDYFADNLQILTEPIPRVIWRGKPGGAPIERVFLWRYGVSIGITYAVAGEGWKECGWIGIILWSALFGWIYGRVYNAFVKSDQTRLQTALFMIFTPLALQCFRDGVLLTVFKTCFYPLLPLLIWGAWTRYLRRARAPSPALARSW